MSSSSASSAIWYFLFLISTTVATHFGDATVQRSATSSFASRAWTLSRSFSTFSFACHLASSAVETPGVYAASSALARLACSRTTVYFALAMC
jgi:hypothetical protein